MRRTGQENASGSYQPDDEETAQSNGRDEMPQLEESEYAGETHPESRGERPRFLVGQTTGPGYENPDPPNDGEQTSP